jgi:hypothetical protein
MMRRLALQPDGRETAISATMFGRIAAPAARPCIETVEFSDLALFCQIGDPACMAHRQLPAVFM